MAAPATRELARSGASLRSATLPRAAGSTPPGPPPRKKGLLGRLAYYSSFVGDPLSFIRQRFDAYGDIYYVPSEDEAGLYVLRHPDDIREVLLARAGDWEKTHTAFDRLQQVLGDGLLTTDGELWKRHRRMTQPAFHHRRLADYAEAMVEEAARAARSYADAEERDMSREMMELTLRVVARTLFSHDVSGETDEVGDAMSTFHDTITRPDLLPEWVPTPNRVRVRRAVEALDRIIYGMIADRRASGGDRPTDLLQMLLDAVDEEGDGSRLTEREVRDQLVTFFLAGHETTSHALTWTWYLLSTRREPRERLHAELDSVLGDRPPDFEDLDRLPYTRMVIEEAMRLYPPAYVLARRARRDTQIGPWEVPAGSECVVWTWMTHHDPRWYPEPARFRPERFTEQAVAERPKLAYLPFGAGPRACIGKGFAMVEAQLVLATMARHLDPRLVPGHPVDVKPRITLCPKHGMRMTLNARKPRASRAATHVRVR